MNKLNNKYSNIEFQHKRFRLLKGEIISKMPLWNWLLYILFKKVLEQPGKNHDIICYIYLFWNVPEITKWFQLIPETSSGMEKKNLVNSGLFSKVPEPSMTMHF